MAEKGTLYLFTGLAGAGKTTLGSLFYERLKKKKPNVLLFDGDVVRRARGGYGYSASERLERAREGFGLAKLITDQGVDLVSCTISMFSEIQEWSRKNIENYVEIYVKASFGTLFERREWLYMGEKNVVGIDIPYDEPRHPDMVIVNEGDESPESIVDRVEKFLKFRYED